ncbi:MAG: TIGR03560 family F420-dependent LLM class oxidoreductase [Acidimicrobiales bacterium]
MRFSVWPGPDRPWADTLRLVKECDEAGWDGAWFADHFMPNDAQGATPLDGPTLECWSVLAGLAASTRRLRLGPLVSGNLYRHPAMVANAAATIDHISGGRFVLGLGSGWQVNEHAAYGIDLLGVKDRMDHLEESAEVITSLLRERRTSFEGRHYRITDAPCDPKPVQDRLPLLIGGRGEQRTMRVAARFADEWNAWTTPEDFAAKSAVLDRRCEEIGRDPGEIRRSTQAMVFLSTDEKWLERHRGPAGRPVLVGTPAEMVDQVGAYRDAGVDELIVPDWTMGDAGRASETLALFWSEVAAHLR